MTDRELEEFLAEKVMGWKLHNDYIEKGDFFSYWDTGDCQHTVYRDSWHPLCEISQAWQVLEKCTDPGSIGGRYLHDPNGLPVTACFEHYFRHANLWACTAEEAAREICEIAVKCLDGNVELPLDSVSTVVHNLHGGEGEWT
jgi:hypothetical protein